MLNTDKILQTIRAEVEERQAYLEGDLTLSGLAARCDTNRTYVSEILKAQFGGFFAYINQCRLAHAAAYQAKHPGAPIHEVAHAAGFRSRQSYYNALHRHPSSAPEVG